MTRFTVQDMHCGACVRRITAAIQAVDADARVACDVAARQVQVSGGQAGAAVLAEAIRSAGYSPAPLAALPDPGPVPGSTQPVAAAGAAAMAAAPAKRGCGCGCG